MPDVKRSVKFQAPAGKPVQEKKDDLLPSLVNPNDLFGIAKGANADNYRDREDRVKKILRPQV